MTKRERNLKIAFWLMILDEIGVAIMVIIMRYFNGY